MEIRGNDVCHIRMICTGWSQEEGSRNKEYFLSPVTPICGHRPTISVSEKDIVKVEELPLGAGDRVLVPPGHHGTVKSIDIETSSAWILFDGSKNPTTVESSVLRREEVEKRHTMPTDCAVPGGYIDTFGHLWPDDTSFGDNLWYTFQKLWESYYPETRSMSFYVSSDGNIWYSRRMYDRYMKAYNNQEDKASGAYQRDKRHARSSVYVDKEGNVWPSRSRWRSYSLAHDPKIEQDRESFSKANEDNYKPPSWPSLHKYSEYMKQHDYDETAALTAYEKEPI